MTDETMRLGIDDSLLELAAHCQLSPEEAREYDRFIELGDIIATLRLKAERRMRSVRG